MTPLTREQQELAVKWRKYAYKCAGRHFARSPHLADIIESRVNLVLCSAARTWNPEKGEFKGWLALWVKLMGEGVYREAGPSNESLNDVVPGTDGLELIETIPAKEDEGETSVEDVDSIRQRIQDEVPQRLVRGNPRYSLRLARLDVADWMRWLDGSTATELGAQRGLSRQRMHQILNRVQSAFDRWALEIRREAA